MDFKVYKVDFFYLDLTISKDYLLESYVIINKDIFYRNVYIFV